jgi:hypothetical protein
VWHAARQFQWGKSSPSLNSVHAGNSHNESARALFAPKIISLPYAAAKERECHRNQRVFLRNRQAEVSRAEVGFGRAISPAQVDALAKSGRWSAAA